LSGTYSKSGAIKDKNLRRQIQNDSICGIESVFPGRRMKTHGIFCVESIIYILYFQPFIHHQAQARSRSHPLIHQSAEGHSGMILSDVPDFLRKQAIVKNRREVSNRLLR